MSLIYPEEQTIINVLALSRRFWYHAYRTLAASRGGVLGFLPTYRAPSHRQRYTYLLELQKKHRSEARHGD